MSNDWDTRLEKYFVDRPQAEEAIQRWLDSPSEKRIFSLVAPPGNGKTWTLRRLYQKWGNPGNRLVVWLDAPVLIRREETQDVNRMIDAESFKQWFDEIKSRATQHCRSLQPISTLADLPAQIGALVEMLCNCSLPASPLLIVDGYDEITEKQAETLGLRILKSFLERECTRLILAHRVEWKVHGLPLYKREVLFLSEKAPLSPEFALCQFEILFKEKCPTDPALDPKDWMEQLKHYRWNHPFINHFLFRRGLKGECPRLLPLTPQDFYECCQAVIERPDAPGGPRYPRLTEDEFRLLHRIAKELGDQWPETDCTSLLGIPSLWGNAHIDRLFNAGLIVPTTPFFQISDGIRGVLREIENLNDINFGEPR